VVAFNKWRWLRAVRVGVTPTFSLYVVPMLSSHFLYVVPMLSSFFEYTVHSWLLCNVVSTASQTAAGNNARFLRSVGESRGRDRVWAGTRTHDWGCGCLPSRRCKWCYNFDLENLQCEAAEASRHGGCIRGNTLDACFPGTT
jgi:hypothetical protein